MLEHFILSWRSEIVLISFNSFFFFPLLFIYFYHSIFYFTNPIFCLCYSTVGSFQSVFYFIYCIIHYILTNFFSRSLLNISCILSILVSRLFTCNSFFFQYFGSFSLSLFSIVFQVDSLSLPLLFGLVGIYHVPLPAEYFSALSSCLDCCVWCGLSVFWQFVVALYFGDSSLWVGLDEWLVRVS